MQTFQIKPHQLAMCWEVQILFYDLSENWLLNLPLSLHHCILGPVCLEGAGS